VSVNCAPLADIPIEGSDDIIGDRAFGTSPAPIIALARAQAEGLMAAGVLPVLKHIPGHGRAMVDSHLELPVVDAPLELLREKDFAPFKALNDLPFGMTAHITYEAMDAEYPATLSPKVLGIIRQEIGFDGLLMGDDLEMKALHTGAFGSLLEIANRSLEAGCDLVLHCNGTFEDRKAVLEAVPYLTGDAQAKALAIQENRKMFIDPLDEKEAVEELASYGLRYEDCAV
jgi:beta-N-acetylhexosaminidase